MSHLDSRIAARAGTAAAREQLKAPRAVSAIPALLMVCMWASGCAYTGSVRDYFDNGLKVGPEYCKPEAPIADAWLDEYDEREVLSIFTAGLAG